MQAAMHKWRAAWVAFVIVLVLILANVTSLRSVPLGENWRLGHLLRNGSDTACGSVPANASCNTSCSGQQQQQGPAPVPPKYTVTLNDTESNYKANCTAFGKAPRGASEPLPRLYDCFLASNELDIMEIHLFELYPVVDMFIILESNYTFRNAPKPLYYPELHARLPKRITDKVHYFVLGQLPGGDNWARERFQRNALFRDAVQALPDTRKPRLDDLMMVADADEIPKPEVLAALKVCGGWSYPIALELVLFYYSYNNIALPVWGHPNLELWRGNQTVLAHDLRGSEGRARTKLKTAGWHCSWCFNRVEDMLWKLAAYSHNEHDTPDARSLPNVIKRVSKRRLGRATLVLAHIAAMVPQATSTTLAKTVSHIPIHCTGARGH